VGCDAGTDASVNGTDDGDLTIFVFIDTSKIASLGLIVYWQVQLYY
jgi:hypothetical protein